MKNTPMKPSIFLITILSFAGGISAQAGTLFTKEKSGELGPPPREWTEDEKMVLRADQELESAIHFRKKIISKTAFLCTGFAGLLGRPIDMSMMEQIKDPHGQRLFGILLQPDLVSSIAEVMEPALTELYETYPRATILAQIDESLTLHRMDLGRLYLARSLGQRYLDEGDEDSLERAKIIVQEFQERPESQNLERIAWTFANLLQKHEDVISERFSAMKLSLGLMTEIINGFSDLKPQDELKED